MQSRSSIRILLIWHAPSIDGPPKEIWARKLCKLHKRSYTTAVEAVEVGETM